MSLTITEQKNLVKLLKKLEFPTSVEVFFAWCGTFGTVCAELVIIREKNGKKEIFLAYRDDKFFKGWHIPGCTHIPTETIGDTVCRVMEKEVSMRLSRPKFSGCFERPKGKGSGKCPRGHEFSFVYTAEPKHDFVETSVEKFFPLKNLPKNILPVQKPIFKALL